jgi:hypothetical protein
MVRSMLLGEMLIPSLSSSQCSFSRPQAGFSSRSSRIRWTTRGGVCGWRTFSWAAGCRSPGRPVRVARRSPPSGGRCLGCGRSGVLSVVDAGRVPETTPLLLLGAWLLCWALPGAWPDAPLPAASPVVLSSGRQRIVLSSIMPVSDIYLTLCNRPASPWVCAE